MCVALLVGHPEKLAKQIRAALRDELVQGWEIKFLPGRNKDKAEINERDLTEIFKKAADVGGAHIIGFHQVGDSNVIARQIRPFFRFRKGDCGLLWSVADGFEKFREHIKNSLLEELEWRKHIKPARKSSPLVLPQHVFSPLHGFETLWEESEMFNREIQYFENLAKKIHQFSTSHTKAYKQDDLRFMVDHARLVWKDAGPYHAEPPFPFNWKYSYSLEPGFHFDVEHQHGKEFELKDIKGTAHRVKAGSRVNIDPHGYRSHG